MQELDQLGRYQKGAAERLVLTTALIALIELTLDGSEQLELKRGGREERLDTIYLCARILKGEVS